MYAIIGLKQNVNSYHSKLLVDHVENVRKYNFSALNWRSCVQCAHFAALFKIRKSYMFHPQVDAIRTRASPMYIECVKLITICVHAAIHFPLNHCPNLIIIIASNTSYSVTMMMLCLQTWFNFQRTRF